MRHRTALFSLTAFLLAAGSVAALAQFGHEARQLGRAVSSDQVQVAPTAVLGDFDEWVVSVAFSPDGKQLAAGTYENVKLFDVAAQKLVATLPVKSGYVKAVAFSPDGTRLAAGDYRAILLFDTKSQQLTQTLTGHRGQITGLSFSPDGKTLASSSEDETVRLWNVADGSAIRTLEGQNYPVQSVAFSPNGKLLATASGDETRVTRPGEVKVFDAATGEEKQTLPQHKRVATGVTFSPDGQYLVSTSHDETANVYELATGKALGFFGGHSRPTNSVLFAHDGKTVITASGGRAKGKNEIKIWNRADGEVWATLEGHDAPVTALALAADGKTLASAGMDNTVVLWNIAPALHRAAGNTNEPAIAEKPAKTEAAAERISRAETRFLGKTTRLDPQASGFLALNNADRPEAADKPQTLRAGIIGLDTSHAIAFTKILNDPKAPADVANCRIVAAYPKGSPDIESSVRRVPGYIEEVKKHGVEIVDSIPALLEKVDVVFLETNDGRPHLEQVLPVLKARKPVFIDKPVAGSLVDAVAIYEAARKYDVPVFSSSSLRFAEGAQALRNGKIGEIVGCDAYSPCSLEATHPDLYWYGIHGVETLFTVMGDGCQSVTRASTPGTDLVVGVWKGGRVGTFRGLRQGKTGYGGTAFGTKGIEQVGPYGGYRPLIVEIVRFFRTGKPPVSETETLEIYAFMSAADESKRQGGVPVTLESVLKKARTEAEKKLAAVK